MKIFLAGFILFLSFQGSAYASDTSAISAASKIAPIDIVFDIDWTTFYTVDANDPNQLDSKNISVEGKTYRPTEHLAEVLQALSQHPEVRISFFSGGDRSRNVALLKALLLPNGKSAYDISYQILSKENLLTTSDDTNLKFSQRYKKSFDGILPGAIASRTILIDDQVEFAKAPWKAVPSLGVFNFQNQFENSKSSQAYFPSSKDAWMAERDKALMWQALLEKAIDQSRNSDKSFAQITSELWVSHSKNALCKNAFIL